MNFCLPLLEPDLLSAPLFEASWPYRYLVRVTFQILPEPIW
jgi:hypothetical protein